MQRAKFSLIWRSFLALGLGAMLGGIVAVQPAQARVFIGVGVPLFVPGIVYPPPIYYPPPMYYPPPIYYPPPMYYAPRYNPGTTFSYVPPGFHVPQGAQRQSLAPAGGAEYCAAGAYTCPLTIDLAPGAPCACLGNDGRRVRGRAN